MQRVLPVKQHSTETDRNPARWVSLPGSCCEAAGGDSAWADDLAQAWFCFYVAAHLLDNVEDRDVLDPELSQLPAGVPTNIATGYLFSAALALDRLHSAGRARPASTGIPVAFYNGFLTMCSGQHLDLITPRPSLEQWQQIASAKSGAFFRLACWGGAALASERGEVIDAYGNFGFRLGLLLQLQDDLGDMRQSGAGAGSLLADNIGRSLPVAYAREVLPREEQDLLSDLLPRGAQERSAALQAIEMLEACGADLFVLTEIERHARLGIEALRLARPDQPAGDKLLALIQELAGTSRTGS